MASSRRSARKSRYTGSSSTSATAFPHGTNEEYHSRQHRGTKDSSNRNSSQQRRGKLDEDDEEYEVGDGEPEEEEEVEAEGDEEDDYDSSNGEETTRCICGHTELQLDPSDKYYNNEKVLGLFIQCDKCNVWQHGYCVSIYDDKQVPDRYWCERCRPDLHKVQVGPNGTTSLYKPVQPKPSRNNNQHGQGRDRDRDLNNSHHKNESSRDNNGGHSSDSSKSKKKIRSSTRASRNSSEALDRKMLSSRSKRTTLNSIEDEQLAKALRESEKEYKARTVLDTEDIKLEDGRTVRKQTRRTVLVEKGTTDDEDEDEDEDAEAANGDESREVVNEGEAQDSKDGISGSQDGNIKGKEEETTHKRLTTAGDSDNDIKRIKLETHDSKKVKDESSSTANDDNDESSSYEEKRKRTRRNINYNDNNAITTTTTATATTTLTASSSAAAGTGPSSSRASDQRPRRNGSVQPPSITTTNATNGNTNSRQSSSSNKSKQRNSPEARATNANNSNSSLNSRSSKANANASGDDLSNTSAASNNHLNLPRSTRKKRSTPSNSITNSGHHRKANGANGSSNGNGATSATATHNSILLNSDKPIEPRIPPAKISLHEMRKRITAISEFIYYVSVDLSEEQKSYNKLLESLQQKSTTAFNGTSSGNTSFNNGLLGNGNGNVAANANATPNTTTASEDDEEEEKFIKNFQLLFEDNQSGSLEMIDKLREKIIDWEGKFGSYMEQGV